MQRNEQAPRDLQRIDTSSMAYATYPPNTPGTQSCFSCTVPEIEVPIIDRDEPFRDVVKKIAASVVPNYAWMSNILTL